MGGSNYVGEGESTKGVKESPLPYDSLQMCKKIRTWGFSRGYWRELRQQSSRVCADRQSREGAENEKKGTPEESDKNPHNVEEEREI